MTKHEVVQGLEVINVCWAKAYAKEDVDEARIKNDKLLSCAVYNSFNWFQSREGAAYWADVCVRLQRMDK